MLALGPDIISPASHSPVPVLLPRGLTPDPIFPSVTATPGPAPSTPANPGPAQQAAAPQFPDTNPPVVAAPPPGKAADPLVAWAASAAEQISQVFCILT